MLPEKLPKFYPIKTLKNQVHINDSDLVSLITPKSHIMVMRIKEMITN